MQSIPHYLTISRGDLDFPRRERVRYSTGGTQFTVSEAFGMPRIPDKILDCVFYLYNSVEDAKAGRNFGGTGFIVFAPMFDGKENEPQIRGWMYAVTNWHVAVRDGASVIRINRHNGPPDIFEFGPDQWEFDPKYDIAVAPLQLKYEEHKIASIITRNFCSKWMAANEDVGPGDDVFMAGRFIDHDGGVTNRPAIRFGNISINPTAMPQGPFGHKADCYCIDLHSRTGYSGSPVFVYRTPGNTLDDVTKPRKDSRRILTAGTDYFGLLGIHFAQFPERWQISRDGKIKGAAPHESLIESENQAYVEGMSGMTCVLPAWSIVEVLNMPKIKAHRKGHEIKLTFGHHMNRLPEPAGGTAPVPESAAPKAKDANPQHREDFNSLLGVAAANRKKPIVQK